MNKRIVLLVVVVSILLIGWRMLRSIQPAFRSPTGSTTRNEDSSVIRSIATDTAVPIAKGENQSAPTAGPSPDTTKSKAELMQEIWKAENATPINVYGKVIDQFREPVAGAKVIGGTLLIKGFERSGEESFSTTTDANGEFAFTGLHGARFGLGIEKSGYVYDPKRYLGWWDTYKPDPANRVTFVLWKLKGAESMVHTSIQSGIACDGTPRDFDPLSGKKDSGNLHVAFKRSPMDIDRGKPFDWTLSLSVTGGGLVEIKDIYPNEAPESGYQSITVTMPADAKNWTPSAVKSFYIFDGNNYGRITVDLMANYQPPPTHIEFEAYINPSGSRNLEFDPAKAVKLPQTTKR